jgi:hypothetical protein
VITADIGGPIARELETDLEGRPAAIPPVTAGETGRDQGDQVVDRLFQVIKSRNEP